MAYLYLYLFLNLMIVVLAVLVLSRGQTVTDRQTRMNTILPITPVTLVGVCNY